jgi:hypothetical protein
MDYTWGDIPGSPNFTGEDLLFGGEELKANEISDGFLLYRYSSVLKQIESLYAEKKELEKEIAARKDRLEHLVKSGQIQMEMEAEIFE